MTLHTRLPWLRGAGAVLAGCAVMAQSHAYEPEIGRAINDFPIIQASGQALDWSPDGASFRILIVGASWCEPCRDLKSSLPNELARLRQRGINVSTIVVEADGFGPGSAGATRRSSGPNQFGYLEAIPDPKRIDLAKESPKGVRDWGWFRAYGYPTTILLDDRNVVVGRYRGGSGSRGVFDDVVAAASKRGAVASAPIELSKSEPAAREGSAASRTIPVVGDRFEEQIGDELIGLWKVNNPEAKDPSPIFLRVIGVTAIAGGALQLEASFSSKLTKWVPTPVRCERAETGCVLRLTTKSGGDLTATRRPDGHYSGTIVYPGRSRPVLRPITIEPMSLDEAAL